MGVQKIMLFIIAYFLVLKGELLLHEAARKNDLETLKLLLSKKVDANAKNNVSICDIYCPCFVKIFPFTLGGKTFNK